MRYDFSKVPRFVGSNDSELYAIVITKKKKSTLTAPKYFNSLCEIKFTSTFFFQGEKYLTCLYSSGPDRMFQLLPFLEHRRHVVG